VYVGLVILIWLMNFGLSFWNAYAAGLAWVETKHAGGWPRWMAWMGAAQSAAGFSWCYLIILGFGAWGLEWITLPDLAFALDLGYVLLIPGVLFSGLMIMLDSWARAYRTRTVRDIGYAAWNTYAEIHNAFHAARNIDGAFANVIDSFGGGSSGKKDKGAAILLVVAMVVVAILGGVITTAVIINRVAGNDNLADRPADEDSSGSESEDPFTRAEARKKGTGRADE
jgi:hypothetical protein